MVQAALIPMTKLYIHSLFAPTHPPSSQLCLGQHQGTAFGRQVVAVIEAQVAALPSSDLQGLVFWWENTVHLRVLLQTLSSNGISTSVSAHLITATIGELLMGALLCDLISLKNEWITKQ
jgi:hypothetical protein